ncbi:MAG: nucleoside triphosphate pyrophosphohydrolase [Clostridiales bacterium]|nr:nucleoside triphosphate pyrophosphohydrolase [Clostridiales bacterium]
MRKPDGCPWDSVQTHESIRINMIEEAYEAVDAIDTHDLENMQEEFGDVLLQSLLQSAIARRDGEFDFDDVCDGLCKKLIGRHTFIFGVDSASNADDALKLWDKNKSVEKHYNDVKSQLQALPDAFPSLLRCQKAHKKIKKSGAAVQPETDLKAALEKRDYAQAIAACTALLSDEGKDAEVELNRVVRDKINGL